MSPVRSYQPADRPEWLRLRRLLWPELTNETNRAEADAWLARPDTAVFLAECAGMPGLAGFAEIGTRSIADGCETGPVAYVEGWYIEADARRKGLGAALLLAAEKWARARGLTELASDAEIENAAAQKAHEAFGFTEVERSVLYRKHL